jgi:hypothetical protein
MRGYSSLLASQSKHSSGVSRYPTLNIGLLGSMNSILDLVIWTEAFQGFLFLSEFSRTSTAHLNHFRQTQMA